MFDFWLIIARHNQEYQTYLTAKQISSSDFSLQSVHSKNIITAIHCILTLIDFRGLSFSSFFAAASMELAAPSNSFSAITAKSSGSSKLLPANTVIHNFLHLTQTYLILENMVN